MIAEGSSLPSTDTVLAAHADVLPQRLLLIQHLRPDTLAFVESCAREGLEVASIVGIPYSVDDEILAALLARGFRTQVPELDEIDSVVADELARVTMHGEVVILDVGGHAAAALQADSSRVVGVVEETTQGLWRYQRVGLAIPVVEIATSKLKSMESRFVGEAVVREVRQALRSDTAAQQAAVLGFGVIGSGCCAALRNDGFNVTVWDPDPVRQCAAIIDGFRHSDRQTAIQGADVILGASGRASLGLRDLAHVRDEVLLASASSRRVEFEEIVRHCASSIPLPAWATVQAFEHVGKRFQILNRGEPCNFLGPSLPPMVADLMFAQLTVGMLQLTRTTGVGVARIDDTHLEIAAAAWSAVASAQ